MEKSYTLEEVKAIALKFTKAATPSEYIVGIEERFNQVFDINFPSQPSEQKQENVIEKAFVAGRSKTSWKQFLKENGMNYTNHDECLENMESGMGKIFEAAKELQNEKDVSKGAEEEILDRLMKDGLWYEINGRKLFQKEDVLKAMQEFSQAQRLQARNEAIQECIDMVRDIAEWVDDEERIIPELEKLKK